MDRLGARKRVDCSSAAGRAGAREGQWTLKKLWKARRLSVRTVSFPRALEALERVQRTRSILIRGPESPTPVNPEGLVSFRRSSAPCCRDLRRGRRLPKKSVPPKRRWFPRKPASPVRLGAANRSVAHKEPWLAMSRWQRAGSEEPLAAPKCCR